jgi:hypothetical protein
MPEVEHMGSRKTTNGDARATQNVCRRLRDVAERFADEVFSCIAWLLLKTLFIDCTLDEVRRRCYKHSGKEAALALEKAKAPDQLLDLCKELYVQEERRKSSVDEKCKVILTISAILLPLMAALLSRPSTPWLGLIPMFCIFFAAFLILLYFDVGTRSAPSVEVEIVNLEPAEFKTEVAKCYLHCANENGRRCDFLVDVYRAARRLLVLGLLLLSIITAVEVLSGKPVTTQEEHSLPNTAADKSTLVPPQTPQNPSRN